MDQGWMAAMFELYKKKIPKEAQNTQQKAENKGNISKERRNSSNNDCSKKDGKPKKPIQSEQCPKKDNEIKTKNDGFKTLFAFCDITAANCR